MAHIECNRETIAVGQELLEMLEILETLETLETL